MISAIVLIQATGDRIPEAAERIVEIEEVEAVYSVTGGVDLIALVQVARHEDLHDVIAGRLSKVDGVVETTTHIAFRTYSKADLGAAFAIGIDED